MEDIERGQQYHFLFEVGEWHLKNSDKAFRKEGVLDMRVKPIIWNGIDRPNEYSPYHDISTYLGFTITKNIGGWTITGGEEHNTIGTGGWDIMGIFETVEEAKKYAQEIWDDEVLSYIEIEEQEETG